MTENGLYINAVDVMTHDALMFFPPQELGRLLEHNTELISHLLPKFHAPQLPPAKSLSVC